MFILLRFLEEISSICVSRTTLRFMHCTHEHGTVYPECPFTELISVMRSRNTELFSKYIQLLVQCVDLEVDVGDRLYSYRAKVIEAALVASRAKDEGHTASGVNAVRSTADDSFDHTARQGNGVANHACLHQFGEVSGNYSEFTAR